MKTILRSVLFSATTVLVSMLGVACSTLVGSATNQQLLVNTAIEFATIKAVEHAKDPKAMAAKARDVIADVESLLADPSSVSLSLDQIDAKVRSMIVAKIPDVADRLLADTVRQAAYNDLKARIGVTVSTGLTASDLAALKMIVGDISNGLVLSGY